MLRKITLTAAALMGSVGIANAIPVNNTIDGAIFLGNTGSIVQDNTQATDSGVATAQGSVENDLWFTYLGTGNNIDLTTSSGLTTFDTQLWIFTGYDGTNLSSLTQVAYNDDGGAGLTSALNIPTALGQQYWFIVDGFAGAEGTFELSYTDLAPVPLPAAGLLLASAFGLGAVATRRRRKDA